MRIHMNTLEGWIAGWMTTIIYNCEHEEITQELLDEFLMDEEFLEHVTEHAMDFICEHEEEGEALKLAVESIPMIIGNVFDNLYDDAAV